MAEGGTGQLRVRRSANSEESIYLPNITSIEATISAQLTEIPTIVFGVDNNFVMDLGTYKTYTITVERATPNDYNDASSDPEDWSNGKWYTFLEKFWDFWQNMTYGKDGKLLGGIHFEYFPGDEGGYPHISENVFLQGSLSASFSVQRLKVSMTLLVGCVAIDDSGLDDQIPVTFQLSDDVSYLRYAVKGAQIQLSAPPANQLSKLPSDGRQFRSWTYNGTKYDVGAILTVEEDMVFVANWRFPGLLRVYDTAKDDTCTVPAGYNNCTAIIVGGGGAGGNAYAHSALYGIYPCGAGGGSGEVATYSFGVVEGATINVHVGAGGTKGGDGGTSSVEYGTLVAMTAGGGLSGDDGVNYASTSVKGGQKYIKGGDTNIDLKGYGGDGEESAGISGKGAIGSQRSGHWHQGGCGGGAADLNVTIYDPEAGESRTFQSIGGDGATDSTTPNAGKYGGGGGSSSLRSTYNPNSYGSGAGGDGLILLSLFKEDE